MRWVQADVVQAEVVQAEVVQNEVVQDEVVQDEVVQAEVVQAEVVQAEVVQVGAGGHVSRWGICEGGASVSDITSNKFSSSVYRPSISILHEITRDY